MRHLLAVAAILACCSAAPGLTPDRVLLVWNSENAESQAVRDAYVAARPGVLELDLANDRVGPGTMSRNQYASRIESPLRAFLDGTDATGAPRSERVVAIATTRGLPARINGPGEFTFASELASLESEMALVYQNLSGPGSGPLPNRSTGFIVNPYYASIESPISGFDRSQIRTARPFVREAVGDPPFSYWTVPALTPGDLYLVCRLDAGNLPDTLALIGRSIDLEVSLGCVQALLDEYPAAADQLDDEGPIFPTFEDFELAAAHLSGLGVLTIHDETANFVTGDELSQPLPLLVLGSYGENHDLGGAGEDPPGDGTYLASYDPHPAGVAFTYESFSGNCLIDGTRRQNQACLTDWIQSGGSFAVASVAEPFVFSTADLDFLVRNLYPRPNAFSAGMTFAEAAYAATPAISWTYTPIGDPLARVTIVPSEVPADLTGDETVGAPDLAVLISAWGSPGADLDGDDVTGPADLAILISAWGPADACD